MNMYIINWPLYIGTLGTGYTTNDSFQLTCAGVWQVGVETTCAPVYWGWSLECLKTLRRIKNITASILVNVHVPVTLNDEFLKWTILVWL